MTKYGINSSIELPPAMKGSLKPPTYTWRRRRIREREEEGGRRKQQKRRRWKRSRMRMKE